ncbi:hypothetical protein A2U01_0109826, partial [Trifolium medium]|nr:hypothetical protein [Trifolium medium]
QACPGEAHRRVPRPSLPWPGQMLQLSGLSSASCAYCSQDAL